VGDEHNLFFDWLREPSYNFFFQQQRRKIRLISHQPDNQGLSDQTSMLLCCYSITGEGHRQQSPQATDVAAPITNSYLFQTLYKS
jgi:hypothetical protein